MQEPRCQSGSILSRGANKEKNAPNLFRFSGFQIQTSQIPRQLLFIKLTIYFTPCFNRASNNLFANLVEK